VGDVPHGLARLRPRPRRALLPPGDGRAAARPGPGV
jgi:hypothetical protein